MTKTKNGVWTQTNRGPIRKEQILYLFMIINMTEISVLKLGYSIQDFLRKEITWLVLLNEEDQIRKIMHINWILLFSGFKPLGKKSVRDGVFDVLFIALFFQVFASTLKAGLGPIPLNDQSLDQRRKTYLRCWPLCWCCFRCILTHNLQPGKK